MPPDKSITPYSLTTIFDVMLLCEAVGIVMVDVFAATRKSGEERSKIIRDGLTGVAPTKQLVFDLASPIATKCG